MTAHASTPVIDPTADDVLVVGAGPAGLVLATALAQGGLRCTVLEQAALPTLAQPRTGAISH
jgi:2-polyprenyl-6-methoxyphenol hydroxylase-like FAD-dependent oxidoreductase